MTSSNRITSPAMTASKTAAVAKPTRAGRKAPAVETAPEASELKMGELSELLGYALKRAQLRVFEDFLHCVAPVQLTPAQFSVLLLLDANPGRNQTEIATTLGILRPNFVAMLDALEGRGLCVRTRSPSDRRSHILMLTDKGCASAGARQEAGGDPPRRPADRTARPRQSGRFAVDARDHRPRVLSAPPISDPAMRF